MTEERRTNKKHRRKKSNRIFIILAFELLIILGLVGSYRFYLKMQAVTPALSDAEVTAPAQKPWKPKDKKSQMELEAAAEQERLKKEMAERQDLIAQANQMTLGYDYDGAINLIKNYKGPDGDYKVYKALAEAVDRLEAEKAALVLYGGSYDSVTQINHIFFHSLIADPSKAFDQDEDAKGYNMYMVTISEFNKILQKLYDDGYVLVKMSDILKKETSDDGTVKYVPNEIYLRQGKKPFVLSQDDLSYYEYMKGDGFASRIVLGEDGKPTCEMVNEDGTTVTGAYDVIPVLDDFVKQHPDFSYKGARGLLALTGYEGILGYRTDDPESSTYEADKKSVKKVVEALKADGWEFSSHSWGHKNMQEVSTDLLKRDTKRWLEEVAPLVGPTDIYVFPFGVDIETTVGPYKSDKYKFLKESGFNIFVGVYKEPWMQIKKDYVRLTRRPIDGQELLEFPERLTDLFEVSEVIDPKRPPKNW